MVETAQKMETAMNRMQIRCPLTFTLCKLDGKWKPLILWALKESPVRFGELRRAIDDVSLKMLTKHLKELEADGMIARAVFPEIPPRVEYSLTDLGRSFIPVLEAMLKWGMEHHAAHAKCEKNKVRGRWRQRASARSRAEGE
jgi:DNA-binding HxlR family transcriptional regulator